MNYIFCLSDADAYMENMAEVISPQGKICSILPLQKPLDMRLFGKSVTFAYELMYTRSVFRTDDMLEKHNALDQMAVWADEGKIKSAMTEHLEPVNREN